MSRFMQFWTCDECEAAGRLEPAEWTVNDGVGGYGRVCERHANGWDQDHMLRIRAILQHAVASFSKSSGSGGEAR